MGCEMVAWNEVVRVVLSDFGLRAVGGVYDGFWGFGRVGDSPGTRKHEGSVCSAVLPRR